MKAVVRLESKSRGWPDPWQFVVVAICTLILCSCRSAPQQSCSSDATPARGGVSATSFAGAAAVSRAAPAAAPSQGAALAAMNPNEAVVAASATEPVLANDPAIASDEQSVESRTDLPCPDQGVPPPYQAQSPWSPPGLERPWPTDEYLRDGGDKGLPVAVTKNSEVLGLEMEDTVAKFETVDGHRMVEPSNKVHIYSPRFGAVRQVVGVMSNEERQKATGVHEPVRVETPEKLQIVAGAKQNFQPVHGVGASPAVAFRTKQGDGALSGSIGPRGFQDRFKTYENLSIIRQGLIEGSDMAMLARGSNAAIAWSNTESVHVVLDHQSAAAEVKYDQSMLLYTVSSPPGKPRLQLVKVASTAFAKPGEEVDFTLRFDNVGTETIGNIVLLDSLNTRLEYVPDTAQCSVDAQFSTQPNEGDSVVLRCELTNPLEPGQGGIVRFRCRVR